MLLDVGKVALCGGARVAGQSPFFIDLRINNDR